MSKIGVVYATKTKHSRKIAEAVGKALNTKAENVKDKPSLGETDLLFIVGGLYGGESLPELLDYVKELDSSKIKKAALITSSAADKKGQDSVRSLLEGKGIKVVDEMRCFGSFLVMKMGHPNKPEINQAVEFAVKLAGKGA